MEYRRTECIYDNPLAADAHTASFALEGSAAISHSGGSMRMENRLDPSLGQAANFVYWCPVVFPDDIEISWDFTPLREPGLCMLFFAARGRDGADLFDPGLEKRDGVYRQYHSGDIDALHVSYFRRKAPKEREFNVCNLRKSRGFHLVAQGADPIPATPDARGPYRIRVVKSGPDVQFGINGLTLFEWRDDGSSYGPVLGAGRIGFRQMAPLVADYGNLTVHRIERVDRRTREDI